MTKPIPGRLAGSPQPAGRRPHSRRRAALPELSGHRWLRTAAVGAGLLALAACGSPAATNAAQTGATTASQTAPTTSTSSPSPSTTAVPPPASSEPTAKATGPTVPPAQVSYTPPEGVPQTVWEQDGGRTLVVMVEEGGCVKVEAQVAKQTADEVDITVLSIAQTHRVCPLYVRNVPVAAHLDAPVGGRKVVLTAQTGTQR